ncbi:MAG: hypothetical protein JXA28_11450, partial [Bacteroidetes bacterium]|nr:hypothetical protein [Bacteroidota bacterium]
MGILLVQFQDYPDSVDSRGSVGFTPPPAPHDTIEHKYRYEDYWNIIFQPSGQVIHPDTAFPDDWAPYGKSGFFQYGSLRRYVEDNSYGLHTIVPYRAWNGWNGLLNTVTPDSTGDPSRARVNWLTIDTVKSNLINASYIIPLAIDAANDSLDVSWDSLGTVIVLYAGTILGNTATGGRYPVNDSIEIGVAISAERGNTGYDGVSLFNYPLVLFHEFFHAAFRADDLHLLRLAEEFQRSGVGHYSLMGDNAPQAAFTPPMLDPWHKLRYGWLRYYVPDARLDTLNLTLPLDTTNFHLPIVEEPFEGGPPYVLVIPIDQHPDEVGWATNADPLLRCIIIENRRAVGWDRVIAVNEDPSQDPHDTTGVGGFLAWGVWYDSTQFGNVWIYDADNDFVTWESTGYYGSPGDFFDGSPGRNTFSIWSSPGVFHRPYVTEMQYVPESRNVYLEFAPYVDSSNVNPISRLVIDRFVPTDHDYGESDDEEVSPTQYGAQQKV